MIWARQPSGLNYWALLTVACPIREDVFPQRLNLAFSISQPRFSIDNPLVSKVESIQQAKINQTWKPAVKMRYSWHGNTSQVQDDLLPNKFRLAVTKFFPTALHYRLLKRAGLNPAFLHHSDHYGSTNYTCLQFIRNSNQFWFQPIELVWTLNKNLTKIGHFYLQAVAPLTALVYIIAKSLDFILMSKYNFLAL